MSSSKERHRHCPLGGVDRNQSPEPTITYTYDIPKPIEYDPNHSTTISSDRGGQTSQMVPHPSPNIPNATSTGSSRPHTGDTPPRDDDETDKIYKEKWRQVFCKYAADQHREAIEKTKDALLKATHNIEEAAATREYLIRNQAQLDQQALLGQAEFHCTEVTNNLKNEAQAHVQQVENNLTAQAQQHVRQVESNLTHRAEEVLKQKVVQADAAINEVEMVVFKKRKEKKMRYCWPSKPSKEL